MRIKRSELVEGKEYYMDNSKLCKGVFVGRDVENIFFDCGMDTYYSLSKVEGKEHLIGFYNHDDFGPFLEVE